MKQTSAAGYKKIIQLNITEKCTAMMNDFETASAKLSTSRKIPQETK
jgi:hypothetical protein